MKFVQARYIDWCAIEPVDADQIDRALEEMWHSGDRSPPGRLCVLHRADGAHVRAAVRMFTNRVCRRLQARHPEARWDRPNIEGSRLASVVRIGADALNRPLVVVQAPRRCTPKSILTGTLKALGDPWIAPFYQRTTAWRLCTMVQEMTKLQQTKMIIFENLPHGFGGEYIASVLGALRRHGLHIVCILP
jgi:hypothetical protein